MTAPQRTTTEENTHTYKVGNTGYIYKARTDMINDIPSYLVFVLRAEMPVPFLYVY
jgi:hypothetical protein